ncbi:hypothetical protein [Streptomyces mirabilis]|uniref:hypothetical protein n=1 Tax=Streptomyces mirabilis TaxID=68239 RepID=UPI0036C5F837
MATTADLGKAVPAGHRDHEPPRRGIRIRASRVQMGLVRDGHLHEERRPAGERGVGGGRRDGGERGAQRIGESGDAGRVQDGARLGL